MSRYALFVCVYFLAAEVFADPVQPWSAKWHDGQQAALNAEYQNFYGINNYPASTPDVYAPVTTQWPVKALKRPGAKKRDVEIHNEGEQKIVKAAQTSLSNSTSTFQKRAPALLISMSLFLDNLSGFPSDGTYCGNMNSAYRLFCVPFGDGLPQTLLVPSPPAYSVTTWTSQTCKSANLGAGDYPNTFCLCSCFNLGPTGGGGAPQGTVVPLDIWWDASLWTPNRFGWSPTVFYAHGQCDPSHVATGPITSAVDFQNQNLWYCAWDAYKGIKLQDVTYLQPSGLPPLDLSYVYAYTPFLVTVPSFPFATTSLDHGFWRSLYNGPLSILGSQLTNVQGMFLDAFLFNQVLNNFLTPQVTNFRAMFQSATPAYPIAFRQTFAPLQTLSGLNFGLFLSNTPHPGTGMKNWVVSLATQMDGMFLSNTAMNENLNAWDVRQVTNFYLMFAGATKYNQRMEAWNPASATIMDQMFNGASSFSQDLTTWCTPFIVTIPTQFSQMVQNLWPLFGQPCLNIMPTRQGSWTQAPGPLLVVIGKNTLAPPFAAPSAYPTCNLAGNVDAGYLNPYNGQTPAQNFAIPPRIPKVVTLPFIPNTAGVGPISSQYLNLTDLYFQYPQLLPGFGLVNQRRALMETNMSCIERIAFDAFPIPAQTLKDAAVNGVYQFNVIPSDPIATTNPWNTTWLFTGTAKGEWYNQQSYGPSLYTDGYGFQWDTWTASTICSCAYDNPIAFPELVCSYPPNPNGYSTVGLGIYADQGYPAQQAGTYSIYIADACRDQADPVVLGYYGVANDATMGMLRYDMDDSYKTRLATGTPGTDRVVPQPGLTARGNPRQPNTIVYSTDNILTTTALCKVTAPFDPLIPLSGYLDMTGGIYQPAIQNVGYAVVPGTVVYAVFANNIPGLAGVTTVEVNITAQTAYSLNKGLGQYEALFPTGTKPWLTNYEMMVYTEACGGSTGCYPDATFLYATLFNEYTPKVQIESAFADYGVPPCSCNTSVVSANFTTGSTASLAGWNVLCEAGTYKLLNRNTGPVPAVRYEANAYVQRPQCALVIATGYSFPYQNPATGVYSVYEYETYGLSTNITGGSFGSLGLSYQWYANITSGNIVEFDTPRSAGSLFRAFGDGGNITIGVRVTSIQYQVSTICTLQLNILEGCPVAVLNSDSNVIPVDIPGANQTILDTWNTLVLSAANSQATSKRYPILRYQWLVVAAYPPQIAATAYFTRPQSKMTLFNVTTPGTYLVNVNVVGVSMDGLSTSPCTAVGNLTVYVVNASAPKIDFGSLDQVNPASLCYGYQNFMGNLTPAIDYVAAVVQPPAIGGNGTLQPFTALAAELAMFKKGGAVDLLLQNFRVLLHQWSTGQELPSYEHWLSAELAHMVRAQSDPNNTTFNNWYWAVMGMTIFVFGTLALIKILGDLFQIDWAGCCKKCKRRKQT